MRDYLFVYGSLMPGRAPAAIAETAARLRPIGAAAVEGRLYDLGEYTGAVHNGGARGMIPGHVLELPGDESVLKSLDAYEGCDPHDPRKSLFVRRRTTARFDDGRELDCWIYVYNREPRGARLIHRGGIEKPSAISC